MISPDTVDNLRRKIANLKQTRRYAPLSLHTWCDSLIREGERELERALGAQRIAPPAPPVTPAASKISRGIIELRNTYPFAE